MAKKPPLQRRNWISQEDARDLRRRLARADEEIRLLEKQNHEWQERFAEARGQLQATLRAFNGVRG